MQSEPLFATATVVDARYKDRFFDMDKKEGARNMLLKGVSERTCGSNGEAAVGSADDRPGGPGLPT